MVVAHATLQSPKPPQAGAFAPSETCQKLYSPPSAHLLFVGLILLRRCSRKQSSIICDLKARARASLANRATDVPTYGAGGHLIALTSPIVCSGYLPCLCGPLLAD